MRDIEIRSFILMFFGVTLIITALGIKLIIALLGAYLVYIGFNLRRKTYFSFFDANLYDRFKRP